MEMKAAVSLESLLKWAGILLYPRKAPGGTASPPVWASCSSTEWPEKPLWPILYVSDSRA